MSQQITVDKDNSSVLFTFSFSQPTETGSPEVVWRSGVGSTYSNAKYYKYANGVPFGVDGNVLPGSSSFLITGINAGTYTAVLQYKFYFGELRMSSAYQSEAYNSLIITVF